MTGRGLLLDPAVAAAREQFRHEQEYGVPCFTLDWHNYMKPIYSCVFLHKPGELPTCMNCGRRRPEEVTA